ncbi:hypothetical protein Tco_0998954 [Tanacetum coccineum]
MFIKIAGCYWNETEIAPVSVFKVYKGMCRRVVKFRVVVVSWTCLIRLQKRWTRVEVIIYVVLTFGVVYQEITIVYRCGNEFATQSGAGGTEWERTRQADDSGSPLWMKEKIVGY